jgi:hypothetical protein
MSSSPATIIVSKKRKAVNEIRRNTITPLAGATHSPSHSQVVSVTRPDATCVSGSSSSIARSTHDVSSTKRIRLDDCHAQVLNGQHKSHGTVSGPGTINKTKDDSKVVVSQSDSVNTHTTHDPAPPPATDTAAVSAGTVSMPVSNHTAPLVQSTTPPPSTYVSVTTAASAPIPCLPEPVPKKQKHFDAAEPLYSTSAIRRVMEAEGVLPADGAASTGAISVVQSALDVFASMIWSQAREPSWRSGSAKRTFPSQAINDALNFLGFEAHADIAAAHTSHYREHRLEKKRITAERQASKRALAREEKQKLIAIAQLQSAAAAAAVTTATAPVPIASTVDVPEIRLGNHTTTLQHVAIPTVGNTAFVRLSELENVVSQTAVSESANTEQAPGPVV